MHLLIAAVVLVASAAAAPGPPEPYYNGYTYHDLVGIPTAARIKASEEAQDFDGSRIVGGAAARVGQYPFAGGIIILLQNGGQSSCGASLISNTRLTTAAHCWLIGNRPARQVTVVLGSITLFSGGVRVVSSRVIPHPQYNPSNLNNDIGVIITSHIGFTANVNRINLPTGNNLFVGVRANAVGFGQANNVPNNSGLRHVQVPVISNQECIRSHPAQFVPASVICTSGAGGRGTCFGDSGGPLQNPSGNLLIGVTSFVHGTGCATGHPAGFARVTSFLAWIRQHM